jgi:hypothetical protein
MPAMEQTYQRRTYPFDRRSLLAGLFTCSFFGLSLAAEAAELTAAKLEALIKRALNEPDTTPLSRAKFLRFTEQPLTTKSIERGDAVHKNGFMVVIPRRTDGLVFFEGSDKPKFFAIHRTGEHLRRVASGLNRDGQLVEWSGPEAEANFAKQKAFWAES